MMRVATYTRISTDEVQQPYSLDAQAQRLESYVKSQEDWKLVASFSDQRSGATLDRPGLRRALGEAQAGRFDLLLVYRVDRVSRSVQQLAQIIEQLDQVNVAFRSATEPFETSTAAGQMMVQMLGVFAEFERATIIDRVIAGMGRKAPSGLWCGGSPPFGYRVVKGEGLLQAVESEARLVRQIFERYTRGRLGSHAIAAELNEAGHRQRNRRFSYKMILDVLRCRVYRGEVHFRGDWFEGKHEAIVDAEVFAAAQQLLGERAQRPGSRRPTARTTS